MSTPEPHHVPNPFSAGQPVPKIESTFPYYGQKQKNQQDDGKRQSRKPSQSDGGNQTNEGKSPSLVAVHDPVTGDDMEAKDFTQADLEQVFEEDDDFEKVEKPSMSGSEKGTSGDEKEKGKGKEAGGSGSGSSAGPGPHVEGTYAESDAKGKGKELVPSKADSRPVLHGSNHLYYPLPPPSFSLFLSRSQPHIQNFLTFILADFALTAVVYPTRIGGIIGTGLAGLAGMWLKTKLEGVNEEVTWDTEMQKSLDLTKGGRAGGIPESANWFNNLLGNIWPLINPDMFTSLADMIEDIMQASLPTAISMVKVTGISQGMTPIRILSAKVLPDSSMEDVEELKREQDKNHQADSSGRWANYELNIAYHGKASGANLNSKLQNPRLEIDFFIGNKLTSKKLPIWVELRGFVATMRLRIQSVPDPPFIKNITLTFMGLPKVNLSAVPLAKELPNALDLPFISNFVNSSIDAAMQEYVAPKSLSLDLSALLMGDGLKKDLDAFGVLIVTIHRARNLEKKDTAGSADPYVVISLSRFGKPLQCSRIIMDCLDPVFEETYAIPISSSAVKADERLQASLWDSDRFSADDKLGKVEVPIRELIRQRGKVQERCDDLVPENEKTKTSPQLEWSAAFYPLAALNKKLKTDGSDPRIPHDLKEQDEALQDAAKEANTEEGGVRTIPPDPEYRSGILSVTIHQIVDCGYHNISGSTGKEKPFMPARNVDSESQEEGTDKPSTYVKMYINDEAVYRTRVKAFTSNPFFNAGSERFIGDWRSAVIMLVVRASEMREQDPILGIVYIKLVDALKNASLTSNFYTLSGGLGYGRVRISLLFRNVKAQLPPTITTWNVGTVRLKSDITLTDVDESSGLTGSKLKVKTMSSKKKLSLVSGETFKWTANGLEMATRRRHASPLLFEFTDKNLIGVKHRKPFAIASKWLREHPDDEDVDIELPILAGHEDDVETLSQNAFIFDTGIPEKFRKIGTLRVTLHFDTGHDSAHHHIRDPNIRELKAAWEEIQEEGLGSDEDGEKQSSDSKAEVPTTESATPQETPEINVDATSSSSEHESEDSDSMMTWLKHPRKSYHKRSANHKALKKEHRGTHHLGAVRTMSWAKGNVKDTLHSLKERTELRGRTPDVETEA